MNSTNKTLYIPLYGKSLVSKKGSILSDPKAEEVWQKEQFPLKGKAKSKWLAYYMGMRAWVFDHWTNEKLKAQPNAVVLHLGCGLDSRCLRVNEPCQQWYDLDMPQVAELRRQYYTESDRYHIIGCDVLDENWLNELPAADSAIVIMEGLSMYLPLPQLQDLFRRLEQKFPQLSLITDVYTTFGVRASAWKNPIQEVGASVCTGIDEPQLLNGETLRFDSRLCMTPEEKIRELQGFEQHFFRLMFAGKASDSIYRIYTYRKETLHG